MLLRLEDELKYYLGHWICCLVFSELNRRYRRCDISARLKICSVGVIKSVNLLDVSSISEAKEGPNFNGVSTYSILCFQRTN